MTINERLLKLRKTLNKSQEEFGQEVGVSRSVIKNIEYNLTEPKPAFIDLLCRTYNVNRAWLETGEGEMFGQLGEDEELAMIFGDLLSGEMDERKVNLIKSIIEIVKSIPDSALPVVAEYAQQVADAINKKESD